MPTYEYVCGTCATRVDIVHSVDGEGPKVCASCGAEDTMRKAFAPPTIHFKGSGWAKKDRSHRAPTKAAEPSGADKSATATRAPSGDGTGPTGEGSGAKAGASSGSSGAAGD